MLQGFPLGAKQKLDTVYHETYTCLYLSSFSPVVPGTQSGASCSGSGAGGRGPAGRFSSGRSAGAAADQFAALGHL